MSSSSRPTILICVGSYLPGYRGGGPIRSISNLVENLSDRFEFKVLTLDHDVGVDSSFDSIEPGEWQQVGSASVRYLSRAERLFPSVIEIVSKTPFNAIYLNAVWPTAVSTPVLLARRLGLLNDAPLVICPRGHLTLGSLAHKSKKKWLYLKMAKTLKLYRDVLWHATSSAEASNIRSIFGTNARVQIAPNLSVSPVQISSLARVKRKEKEAGRLRAVFLSRIAPIKNLVGALQFLQGVQGNVELDIYGPVKDQAYWSRCKAEMMKLPANVKVTYNGPVSHDKVLRVFGEHDLLLLPTRGENFGHAIFEALSTGCPVLISDQTPWRDLRELKAGWDFPLDSPQKFREALQWCTNASDDDYKPLRDGARRLARSAAASEENVGQVQKVFERAISER